MVTDDKLDDGLLDPFLLFVFRVSALVAFKIFLPIIDIPKLHQSVSNCEF